MSIVSCPECGKQVSSAAAQCPSCGHPIARQRQAHKQYGCGTLVIIGIVLLILFSVFDRSAPVDRAPAFDDVGADVVLYIADGKIPLASTEAAYAELIKLLRANDALGLAAAMQSPDRFFAVDSGTNARVLAHGFERREVRIMEGPQFARSGWVLYSLLRSPSSTDVVAARPPLSRRYQILGIENDKYLVAVSPSDAQNEITLRAIVVDICSNKPRCDVMVWTDAGTAPRSLPMTDTQVRAMTSSYTRDKSTSLDRFRCGPFSTPLKTC